MAKQIKISDIQQMILQKACNLPEAFMRLEPGDITDEEFLKTYGYSREAVEIALVKLRKKLK